MGGAEEASPFSQGGSTGHKEVMLLIVPKTRVEPVSKVVFPMHEQQEVKK